MHYINKKTALVVLIFFLGLLNNVAQEEHEKEEQKHSIAILLSHTQVHEAIDENGNDKWLSLPSFQLNYTYELNASWGIGLHTDFIFEEFNVEHIAEGKDNILQRRTPIAPALVAIYNPWDHLGFLLGAGGEFAKEGNLFLIRIGIEYGYDIHENWELVANITNDVMTEGYNSFSLGIGITRKF